MIYDMQLNGVLLMQPIMDFHNEKEEYIYWHIKKKLFFLKIA